MSSTYPAYRDSRIAWLGMIPVGWNVVRLRHVCDCLDSLRVPLNAAERADRQGDIPYWGANSVVDYVDGVLCDGELVLLGEDGAPFLEPNRTVAFFNQGPLWPNNHVHVLRPRTSGTGKFIAAALNATDYGTFIEGATRDKLTQAAMKSIPIPWPSYPEQAAIAAFIEAESSQLDRLISEQQHLIELLNEKRQALISRAVTKGLNPVAPMKRSGVEWLGDVPAHWELCRGRWLFRKLDLPPHSDDGVVTAFRDGQVTLRDNRRTDGFTLAVLEVGYQRVRTGDLVIHGMDAFAGAIGVSESTGKCSPEYVVLTPARFDVDGEYFAMILRLMAKRNFIYVICPSVRERAPRFRFEAFKDVILPVPPLDEQRMIASHIRKSRGASEALQSRAEKSISLLQERRTASIAAAVSGHIDVRGLVGAEVA